ncbi:MAG: hypothetical protein U0520_01345 [Candidatus Saccharimonadales bacterium]
MILNNWILDQVENDNPREHISVILSSTENPEKPWQTKEILKRVQDDRTS